MPLTTRKADILRRFRRLLETGEPTLWERLCDLFIIELE
jgi:hypothetical protein